MPKKSKPPSFKAGDAAVAQYADKLDGLDHRALALWAAKCAEHVLPLFEREHPDDNRPRKAIESARSWAHGKISMMDARAVAVTAHAAARACTDPAATFAARASGHAVATAHSKRHARGAAAYAITARAAASTDKDAIHREQQWQIKQLPKAPPKRGR